MMIGSILHFFVVIYSSRIPNMFEDIEEDMDNSDVILFEKDKNAAFIIKDGCKES